MTPKLRLSPPCCGEEAHVVLGRGKDQQKEVRSFHTGERALDYGTLMEGCRPWVYLALSPSLSHSPLTSKKMKVMP